MKNNFYDELIKKINDYCDNNQLAKAILLIEEELEMPYIPSKIEDFLKERYSEINNKLFKNNKRMEIEKIFEILNSDIKTIDKFDLISNLWEHNLMEYKEEIKSILLLDSKLLDDDAKKHILMILLEQNNKDKWIVNLNKRKQEIDLSRLIPPKKDEEFISLSSKIQEILFKNPVALNMSLNILEMTFISKIFDNEEMDTKNAEYFIILKVLNLLNDQDEFELIYESAPSDVKEFWQKKKMSAK